MVVVMKEEGLSNFFSNVVRFPSSSFATLMRDAGELPGWVEQMMGQETLQMVHEKYYSFIKNTREMMGGLSWRRYTPLR